jgi:hypothetical protein
MSLGLRSLPLRRAGLAIGATLAAGGMLMAGPGAASAATLVHVKYKVTGSTFIKATTRFINDGPTTGKLNLNTGAVTTTSTITLQIVSLTVAGLPAPVGTSCQTASPVVVTVKSQKGFNVLKGGNLAGIYAIGRFQHCKLATLLLNATIPGPGNTITLTLGQAHLG